MPLISIRRCAEVFSVQRCFEAVRLINRHALLLGPLLAATFAIVAGWIASDYGAQYLFRDNERLDYFGLCDPGYPCIWKSARLHSALYATALMGLVWTLFVLIESWDQDPKERHPVEKVVVVLPGVILLGLIMVAAVLLNGYERSSLGAVLGLSLLGFLVGLVLVGVITKLGLLLSKWLGVHQMWTFLALSIVVAIGVAYLPVVTPAKAIFIALAAVVIVYCAFEIAKAHYRFPLALAIAVALMAGAVIPKFKYQFPGLESYYEQWRVLPEGAPKAAQPAPTPLLDPRQTLEAWLARQPQGTSDRKLVVVATSGGAYRATFWSTIVLDCLTSHLDLPHFDRAIRLMTGASGGMVGNAYFAASRIQPAENPAPAAAPVQAAGGCNPTAGSPEAASISAPSSRTVENHLHHDLQERQRQRPLMLANAPTDSLTPVVARLIGKDMLYAFYWKSNLEDRGVVLEKEWTTLQLTFAELERGEREGWRPSLIVSPYLVESAKPMFISNLNLEGIITGKLAEEFFRTFPGARDRFRLATAVRMSSTFPLISPAVRLPLPNRDRVVDAGYFDNFGITAAAMFLRNKDVQQFIKNNNLQVILIRILAFPNEEPSPPPRVILQLEQIAEQITSPLEGALAARETRGRFANDLLLEGLEHTYENRFHQFQFVARKTRASFSWHLQAKDLEDMRRDLSDPKNLEELKRLVEVWSRKAAQ
jgi:hypothetical protein